MVEPEASCIDSILCERVYHEPGLCIYVIGDTWIRGVGTCIRACAWRLRSLQLSPVLCMVVEARVLKQIINLSSKSAIGRAFVRAVVCSEASRDNTRPRLDGKYKRVDING